MSEDKQTIIEIVKTLFKYNKDGLNFYKYTQVLYYQDRNIDTNKIKKLSIHNGSNTIVLYIVELLFKNDSNFEIIKNINGIKFLYLDEELLVLHNTGSTTDNVTYISIDINDFYKKMISIIEVNSEKALNRIEGLNSALNAILPMQSNIMLMEYVEKQKEQERSIFYNDTAKVFLGIIVGFGLSKIF